MAGRPNVGKTTLMRNILKSEVGIVGDAANVTRKSYIEENSDVKIAFIDCPGFNESGRVLDALEYCKTDEEIRESLFKKDLKEDYYAYKGVKAADVIYFVVSVANVPEKGDNSLMSLIKESNLNIIGIINMAYHVAKGLLKNKLFAA
jgi:GTPase Era involved in 16S rRNA processing